jgi:hypothetical protein
MTDALNLDDLERSDDPGPFPVTFGGRTYELLDPNGVSWRDLTDDSESRIPLIRSVAEDQREDFTAAFRDLPAWKATKLVEAYNDHYKLPSVGEGDASPTS